MHVILSRLVVMAYMACAISSAHSTPLVDQLTLYAEDSPPHTYFDENHRPAGWLIEATKHILSHAKATEPDQNIRILPWIRAFELARHEANTIVFPTARKPEREEHFIWIGPIASGKAAIYGPAYITPPDTADYFKDKVIATIAKDVSTLFLKKAGLENTQLLRANHGEIIQLLKIGRVNYVALNAASLNKLLTDAALDKRFKLLYTFDDGHTYSYYAINKNSTPEAIAAFKQAFDTFVKSPEYKTLILDNYPGMHHLPTQ